MSTHHHPTDELLLDYATGALPEAWSLAVATHLTFCPSCRRVVESFESAGGGLLETLEPSSLEDDIFDRVMVRIDAAPSVVEMPIDERQGDRGVLPSPLLAYIPSSGPKGIPWKALGLGASQCLIPVAETGATARLLRIPAGRPVPKHGHRGLELTVVLAGAFEDSTGHYQRGDLQQADESLLHRPHATPEEDCICLAVTDAPLRFSSFVVRAMQPLLRI